MLIDTKKLKETLRKERKERKELIDSKCHSSEESKYIWFGRLIQLDSIIEVIQKLESAELDKIIKEAENAN